jgi:phage gpG-like protein
MTMVFNSLASFAAHLVTMEADVKLACDAAVVKASKLVAKTAKGMLGHEQPFWPALKPETIERKARGNTPLIETGALRDSIEWTAPVHEGGDTVGYVGSNHPEATWHELGTSRIPPRPFLSIAAMGKEGEVHEIMGRLVFGAMVHGGPHYREFIEVLHALRHAYHEVKKLGEELVDDDEN